MTGHPKPKRPRKPSLRTLDSLFSQAVRQRDHYTCQRCGTRHAKGSPGLHASHFIGRANRSTRWCFDNVDALCNGCHQYMETHKATEYLWWKRRQLGGVFDVLLERSRTPKKWTPDELRELASQLRQTLKEQVKV